MQKKPQNGAFLRLEALRGPFFGVKQEGSVTFSLFFGLGRGFRGRADDRRGRPFARGGKAQDLT